MRLVMAAVCALLIAGSVEGRPIGQVKEVRGDAVLERAGRQAPAAVGDDLEEADIVITGANSAVGLTLGDNSTYALGPESRLEITRYLFRRGGGSQLRLRLDDGQMTVKTGDIAAQGPDAMQVQTPTTVVGVRGTYFIVGVDGE